MLKELFCKNLPKEKDMFHSHIPMGTKVNIPKEFGNTTGTVIGISSYDVIFHYIILLDNPIKSEFGELKAISVPGVVIKTIDGNLFNKI